GNHVSTRHRLLTTLGTQRRKKSRKSALRSSLSLDNWGPHTGSAVPAIMDLRFARRIEHISLSKRNTPIRKPFNLYRHCIWRNFFYLLEDQIPLLGDHVVWGGYHLSRGRFISQDLNPNEPAKAEHCERATVMAPVEWRSVQTCGVEADDVRNGKDLILEFRINHPNRRERRMRVGVSD